MKNWKIGIDVGFKVSADKVAKALEINNPENVNENDVRQYAEQWQESMAGSNDGSEMIANANLIISPV